MRHQTMHELAKFAAGLVAGDLLALLWIWAGGVVPSAFLGFHVTSSIIFPAVVFDTSLVIILVHYGWNIGKTPMLRERTYLLVAAGVFGIVSFAHLVRIFTGAGVTILGWDLPLWLSWVGTVATGYLSYMSFRLSMRR